MNCSQCTHNSNKGKSFSVNCIILTPCPFKSKKNSSNKINLLAGIVISSAMLAFTPAANAEKPKSELPKVKQVVSKKYRSELNLDSSAIIYHDIVKMGVNCYWASVQSPAKKTINYSVKNMKARKSQYIIPVDCSKK